MAIAIWLAQLLRRYLLLWVWSLVWRGWRRPLEAHDLPALPPGLTQSDASRGRALVVRWREGKPTIYRRPHVALPQARVPRWHRDELLLWTLQCRVAAAAAQANHRAGEEWR